MTGYVVLDNQGKPTVCHRYSDSPLIIVRFDRLNCGTIFKTYEKARAALRRTKRYEKRKGFCWGVERFRIMAMVGEPK